MITREQEAIDEKLKILRSQGLSTRKVSIQLQLPERFVIKRIAELGLPHLKKGGDFTSGTMQERALLLSRLVAENKTTKEIAIELGISTVAVNKRLHKLGVKPYRQRKIADDREKRNLIWGEYQNNPNIANRNKLVDANLKLVHKIAHGYSNHSEYDDLVQEGTIGLIKAIEGFNLSLGYQFSSYAVPLIKGEILHYFRDRSRPIKTRLERIECLPLNLAFSNNLGDSPTQLLDTIPAPEKNTTEIMDLRLAVESLDKKYQRVIDLYYFQMMERKAIARILGISPMTVTRHIDLSIAYLRKALN